jgi:DNA polymerase III epsilon subunit-like protein
MIYLSLDFETTGLNVVTDRVIEFGAVLYSTAQKKCLDSQGPLVKTDLVISTEITQLTGVTKQAVDRFGYAPEDVLPLILDMIKHADAVIGFNCRRFDYHVLYEWVRRENQELPNKPWIDLYYDLPWSVPVGKLSHVAADHGILNLFPHSALADAQTVLSIAAKYDEQLLLQRAQSPIVVLRSHQARHENDLVKKAPFKFRWNGDRKIWWKPVKEQDVTEIIQSAPFSVSIEKDFTPEELDN